VFTECGLTDLVTGERTLVGKEFHARGPATEKAALVTETQVGSRYTKIAF